jgi:hypothetical protein
LTGIHIGRRSLRLYSATLMATSTVYTRATLTASRLFEGSKVRGFSQKLFLFSFNADFIQADSLSSFSFARMSRMSLSPGWLITFTVAEYPSCQSAQNPIGCLLKSSSRRLKSPLK